MRATEKHFSVKEIAEAWHLHGDTVRSIFANEPDVIKLGSAETVRPKKRAYAVMRIPEHVLQRVYNQLHSGEKISRKRRKVVIKKAKRDQAPVEVADELQPLTDSERERLHAIFEDMKHLATPLDRPPANVKPSRFRL